MNKEFYLVPEELLKVIEIKYPNVAMAIRYECQKTKLGDLEIPMNFNSRVITKQQRYEVLKRQKWACNQCGCKLKYSINNNWIGEIAHIDHIHPFSKRETYHNGVQMVSELSNLQALCPSCNLSKSNKEVQ